MDPCPKAYYADQAVARLALEKISEKAERRGRGGQVPVRVYPCDVCDGWHLTAKLVKGKTPAWETDPNWVRPGNTDHLQRRGEVSKASRRQPRRRAT